LTFRDNALILRLKEMSFRKGGKRMIYYKHIEINPRIMLGKPVIRGTRIPVYVVLNLLGEGYTSKQIIKEYPDLTKEDILAVLKFAAKTTQFEEQLKTVKA